MFAPDVVTVAVTRVDGGVTVMRVVVNEYIPDPDDPAKRALWRHHDPTPEYVDSLIQKYVADGCWVGGQLPVSWEFVSNDYVDETTDRHFRDAWTHAPGHRKPAVDMPKAREVHREHLRKLRSPLLDALDLEYMRADEQGDQQMKLTVATRKQALRDVTDDPAIDAAKSPDELKAVLPEALL